MSDYDVVMGKTPIKMWIKGVPIEVEQLRYMQDHTLVRNIDSSPSFHGTFEI